MPSRLLDRQRSLLEYLTSGATIFGDGGACTDETLHGIDLSLLRLEARFSYEKRMEKIAAVLPLTFEMLGNDLSALLEDFVVACPPSDIGRIVNARQFCDFVSARHQAQPANPPYLPDVAACELAYATVCSALEGDSPKPSRRRRASRPGFRRRPIVVMLRCKHDIRAIFEGRTTAIPDERTTLLAVTMPPSASQPQVFELLPIVFELVTELDDWTDLTAFRTVPHLDDLVGELEEHGLVEVRR